MTVIEGVAPSRTPLLHDGPAPLPAPRGPVSSALLTALVHDASRTIDLRHLVWDGQPGDACTDEDLQLSLWLAYELHYRGLAGVDERWEWHPELIWARARWEEHLLAGLELAVPSAGPAAQDAALALVELVDVEVALRAAVAQEGDDPLALFLTRA